MVNKFHSILDAHNVAAEEKIKRPVFYQDLNLDQLIDVIARSNNTYEIKDYFYYFPANEVCERYRREVYQDVKKPCLNVALNTFCEGMYKVRHKMENINKVNLVIQQKAWHISGAAEYANALVLFEKSLSEVKDLSLGFGKLQLYLKEVVEADSFKNMLEEANSLKEEIGKLHFVVTLENERINVVKSDGAGEYENKLRAFGGNEERMLRNPFGDGYDASMLEKAMLEVLGKTSPKLYKAMFKFEEKYPDFIDNTFLKLEQELQFYLSFYKFTKQMEENGCLFSMPVESDDGTLTAKNLYDVMLAYSNNQFKRATVSNDVEYKINERFLIVSGPNQGGKTTFARSLGQLIYFKKMGLDVPATEAVIPHYERILTHFSVEESMETGHGKLKEELTRLQPMMQKDVEKAFVVINELFTTAANYDAYIMGERVLDHFMKQGCYGVYVTHIKELAKEGSKIVSLRAMLDETDYRKRTFKIVRTSKEVDGHAGDIAEKYGLSYEQLKERLKFKNK